MEIAPRDGTEIIVRDSDRAVSLAAWCANPGECCHENDPPEPGWYRSRQPADRAVVRT
jgi:hypothetical protein